MIIWRPHGLTDRLITVFAILKGKDFLSGFLPPEIIAILTRTPYINSEWGIII
jgi:hypothetical protein